MTLSRELAIVKTRLEKEQAKLHEYTHRKLSYNVERTAILVRIALLQDLMEEMLK